MQKKESNAFWILDPLKMEPKGCPETSVKNYHYSLVNNPEERSSLLRSITVRTDIRHLNWSLRSEFYSSNGGDAEYVTPRQLVTGSRSFIHSPTDALLQY